MDAPFDTLLSYARELSVQEERAAYLDEACAGDLQLRARIEARLMVEAEAAAYFGEAVTRIDPVMPAPVPGEEPGAFIGPFKLLQQIGEGGFGTVWMADQQAPVRRRVALKIIKQGLDTREVIARFEQERQALAMMDHANIARVFDAGATQSGRPFFVMELVRGVKITEYCDEHGLDIPDRVRLFIQVCHAVHHAHQKGIIHRDIKPSNVLVTINDGEAVVKVIDFGVAKATLGSLTDATLFTQFHQMIGTPAYMSPEQAEMTSLDIDTRSDIYSLGVLLYELITGGTPIDTATLARAGLDELRRVIRDVTPPRPSARVKTLSAAELTTTAKRRRTDGARLTTSLRGDLDWIAMMCLEKDRRRRYDSANALALDLQRYLAHGVVTARPPTASYLLGRIVRRHRVAFIAGSSVALSLVAGAVVSTWLYFREREALGEQSRLRGEAEKAQLKAENEERTAKTETSRTRRVSKLLVDMLKGAGPSVAQGRDTSVLREILAATAARIDLELKDDPMVDAAVRDSLATVYYGIGMYEEAAAMFRRALELYQQHAPASHRAIAVEMASLGGVQRRLGHAEDAEKLMRQSLDILQEHCADERRLIARGMLDLGTLLEQRGNLTEAGKMNAAALESLRSWITSPDLDVADALRDSAEVLYRQGSLAESESKFKEAMAMYRELYPQGHYTTLPALNGLGNVLAQQDKLEEGITWLREALDLQEQLTGANHPDTAVVLVNLADVLSARNELEEAETLQRRALKIVQDKFGAEHTHVAAVMNALARVLMSRKQFEESEKMFRDALEMRRKLLPEGHRDIAISLNNLATLLWDAKIGRDEAKTLITEAVTMAKAKPREHAMILVFLSRLADILTSEGNHKDAGPFLEDLLAFTKQRYSATGKESAQALYRRLENLVRQDDYHKAEPLAREYLTLAEKLTPGDWRVFYVSAVLGECLVNQENRETDAAPLLLSGCNGMWGMRSTLTPSRRTRLQHSMEVLVKLYTKTGQTKDAGEWQEKLTTLTKEAPGQ